MTKKTLNIPEHFELLGSTISVEFDPKLIHKHDAKGRASFRENKIYLMPDTPDYPMAQDKIGDAFCHEVIHFIDTKIGDILTEEQVEMFGAALHQVLVTFEGNLVYQPDTT